MQIDTTTKARETPAVPARQRGRRDFAAPYFVAVVTGGASAYLNAWWIAIPAMLFYLFHGLPKARKEGIIIEFSDSFYYLGFTITIFSLLAAADPFGLHGTPTESGKDILKSYGLGLTSTVIGIIGRNVIQLFYLAPNETTESTAARVAEETAELLRNLEALGRQARFLVEETATRLQNSVTAATGRVELELADLASRLAQVKNTIEAVSIDPSRIVSSFQVVEASSRRAADGIDRALTEHHRLRTEIEAAEREVLSLLGDAGREVRNFGGELGRASTAARDALDRLAARVPHEQLGLFAQTVDGIATRLGDLAGTRETLESVRTEADGLAKSMKQAGLAFRKAVDGDLVRALQAGENALVRFSDMLRTTGVERFNAEVTGATASLTDLRASASACGPEMARAIGEGTSGVDRLKTAVQETAAHIGAVNRVLDEIADAVRVRIERL